MNSQEFNRIQEDVVKNKAKAAERVGWFAGATISLSFTLLGFLLTKRYFIFLINESRFLLSALILGWVFLGVSILGSLIISWLGQTWLSNASSSLYLMTEEPFAKAMANADPKLKTVLDKRTRRYARILNTIELLVYAGGILGIISLLLFLIGLTLAFVS